MSILSGKKILLGITGGIAAYKTAHLTRLLIKAEAQVQVVMTPSALDFITPLTLSTLSKNKVYINFFDDKDNTNVWNNHVDLALWADILLIAPATANTISKMAQGLCDNLLMAIYLSAKCKVYIAPAMDLDMYKHFSTQENFKILKNNKNIIIPAELGELASGLIGEGRMAEPENIVTFLENSILENLPLYNKTIMVTAGPTYEAIDPVRFIGNHSSGKMGFDIAIAAANKGAKVILISGPSSLDVNHKKIQLIRVTSAEEMFNACINYFNDVDAVVAAAAVADYKPKNVASQKIKKTDNTFVIELEKTKDILSYLGNNKKNQMIIGFALETENEIEHAKQKITKKNVDLIVLNSLNDKGAGFKSNTNKVTFIDKNFNIEPKELKAKEDVALDIINKIIEHYEK